MIKSVRIQNLRSLHDTGSVELRPLTILVGANSSGKSSFLRFFPLLRQTASTTTNEPLLWFGDDVDFGDFQTALRRSDRKKPSESDLVIDFSIEPDVSRQYEYEYELPDRTHTKEPATLSLFISATSFGSSYVRCLEVSSKLSFTRLAFSESGALASLSINGTPIQLSKKRQTHFFFDGFLPNYASATSIIDSLEFDEGTRALLAMAAGLPADLALDEDFGARRSVWLRNSVLADITRRALEEGSREPHDLRAFLESSLLTTLRSRRRGHGPEKLPRVSDTSINQLVTLSNLSSTLDRLDRIESELKNWSRNIAYIGPFRTAPERYYRQQALAADRISRDGGNLAMFLASLDRYRRREFASWVKKHFDFSIAPKTEGSHVALSVSGGARDSVNLVDTGFGISQVLPVIAQCWLTIQDATRPYRTMGARGTSLLAIEQPELHLHPCYQAKLADMFASLVSELRKTASPPPLIIETHSEALLNRVGDLVEERVLLPEEVGVLLFHRPSPGQTIVSSITYNRQGRLSRWPVGFFSP